MLTSEKLLKFDLLNITIGEGGEGLEAYFKIYSKISQLMAMAKNDLGLIVELPGYPIAPETRDSIFREGLAQAVGSTTSIEGNTLSTEEIHAAFEKADKNFTLEKLEQEVQNSREVYQFLIDVVYVQGITKISLELIRQIHYLSTKKLPYIGNKPGQIRASQVDFGIPRLPSLFPDQFSVENALNAFIEWYNKKKNGIDNEAIVKAVLSHYYFTEIHPFTDGNGRTARAIEAFCLLAEKVIPPNFFYTLANYWARNRDQYLNELRKVRTSADASSFTIYGIKGLVEELGYVKYLVLRKHRTLMFKDYVHYLFREKKKKPHRLTQRMVDVLEILSTSGQVKYDEFINSAPIRALYSAVTASTKSRDLKKMRENSLINTIEKNDGTYIECNFDLLAGLGYRI